MSLSYATVAVLYGCVEVIRPSNVVDKVAVEKKFLEIGWSRVF